MRPPPASRGGEGGGDGGACGDAGQLPSGTGTGDTQQNGCIRKNRGRTGNGEDAADDPVSDDRRHQIRRPRGGDRHRQSGHTGIAAVPSSPRSPEGAAKSGGDGDGGVLTGAGKLTSGERIGRRRPAAGASF